MKSALGFVCTYYFLNPSLCVQSFHSHTYFQACGLLHWILHLSLHALSSEDLGNVQNGLLDTFAAPIQSTQTKLRKQVASVAFGNVAYLLKIIHYKCRYD